MEQNSVYDFCVKDNKGNEVSLSQCKGKVLLIVNTATACGFTPQYNDLDQLYDTYAEKGFEILDFPCNQFGSQAQGSDEEINEFCTLRYNTKFPRFKKIEVNGENELPLYTWLKKNAGEIKRFDSKHPFMSLIVMLMEKINKTVEIKHPELDITTVDLVEFYGPAKSANADKQNVVIFGEAQADRSPCGTGTSAKLATLYARGEIKIGEPFVYESFMCTQFIGKVKEETTMGPFKAIRPTVTGAAYLTGEATYAIDPMDKLGKGFIVG